jgi:hypothetical protein
MAYKTSMDSTVASSGVQAANAASTSQTPSAGGVSIRDFYYGAIAILVLLIFMYVGLRASGDVVVSFDE